MAPNDTAPGDEIPNGWFRPTQTDVLRQRTRRPTITHGRGDLTPGMG